MDWDGNELLLSDILGTDGDTVNRELEQEVERSALRGLVSGLGEREQRIMRLRFGLDGGEERTQKEVADIIGISQSYISRLEKKIIRQLREEMQQIYMNGIGRRAENTGGQFYASKGRKFPAKYNEMLLQW